MRKRSLLISSFLVFGFLKLFSQDVLLQDFKCKDFELKYPKLWKLDTTDNKYYFTYNPKIGDITVSTYESYNYTG